MSLCRVKFALGVLRLALNSDYDRIMEPSHEHRTLRQMLGHGFFDEDNRNLSTMGYVIWVTKPAD